MDTQMQEQVQQAEPPPIVSSTPEATEYAEAPSQAKAGLDKNVLHMPTSALSRIKQEQRERGRKEAMAELEAKAKSAGFSSFEDMVAYNTELRSSANKAVKAAKSVASNAAEYDDSDEESATPEKPVAPTNKHDRRAMAQYERDRQQWAIQMEQAKRQRAHEEKKRRELQRQLDANEARSSLEKLAIRRGVQEVDFAMHLLQRELEGKTEKDLSEFDEGTFFDRLRESRPYLFGEVVRPATTGTGTGSAPSVPKPGQVAQTVATNGQFDARKASPTEFQTLLRKRGFNPSL